MASAEIVDSFMPSGAAATAWLTGAVPFALRAGEITFACPTLPLLRRSAALDEVPLQPEGVPQPPANLGDAVGFLVRSMPIAETLPTIARRRGWLIYVPQQYNRYLINLSGDYSEYMAGFTAKSRSSIKRKIRKFTEASGGKIVWRQFRSAESLSEFFNLALTVSANSYQERLFQAGLPSDPAFIAKAKALAGADRLRAYILMLDDRAVSYLYCPASDGILYYDHVGYDQNVAELSPGFVIQMLALKELFAERCFRYFDFTEGEGQHKRFFATDAVRCADIYTLMPGFRNCWIVALHSSSQRLSANVGVLLDRLGLKTALRRAIRRF